MLVSNRYEEAARNPLFLIDSSPLKPMKTWFYIVANKKGAQRMTQTAPKLQPGEISVRVQLEAPDALFQTPQIVANISIPESAAQPEPISAEVRDNVRELIQSATGMEVRLILEPQAE